MLSREIMTENPEVVLASDSLEEAARRMRDLDVGVMPVVEDRDGRRLEGVITDRDIVVRHVAEGHGAGCKVEEAMSRDGMVTVGPEDDVELVASRMSQSQVRRVPVVESGRLVGIIAQADLAIDASDDRLVGATVEAISAPGRPER
ncbi:MAG TPA: CBS domain-containing protein [Thermoanaerobaculia bacterium]|nr:CBS domain-containing protein [Thermoanaerobaculia bacterium]